VVDSVEVEVVVTVDEEEEDPDGVDEKTRRRNGGFMFWQAADMIRFPSPSSVV